MDIISPKMDFCVKELFANPVIRKYFISDVMGIPADTIRSVRLCNPYILFLLGEAESVLSVKDVHRRSACWGELWKIEEGCQHKHSGF